MHELREQLLRAAVADPDAFHELFWRGRTVGSFRNAQWFVDRGLLRRPNGRYRSRIQIWSRNDELIMTDRPDYRPLDRVFPIFSDESLLLSQFVLEDLPARLLDVGTGSGILAIEAAQRGAKVVAVDINPRALRVARLNAQLNRVAHRIDFIQGDALNGLSDVEFDLVVSNPPFVAVPPGCPFHIAGLGGADGTHTVRKVLARVAELLAPKGKLVMSALSLVRDGSARVVECAKQLLPREMNVRTVPIYDGSISLSEFSALFHEWDGAGTWEKHLRRSGYDSLQYFVLLASRADIKLEAFPRQPEHTRFSGTWDRRFTRYRYWLDRTSA